jgi:hypothetical protein
VEVADSALALGTCEILPFSDLEELWPLVVAVVELGRPFSVSGSAGEEVRAFWLDPVMEAEALRRPPAEAAVEVTEEEGVLPLTPLPEKLALSNRNQSNQRVFFSV